MDIRELPARPSLEPYKKQAKDLVKGCKSGDADARLRISRYHPRFRTPFVLADARLTIAREHGFESWPKFSKHIEALSRGNSSISRFESAVDAIVAGDIIGLERLLRRNPELVRARSTREHRATLLHYVAANGIEDYRQKTPSNAVAIAETLLKAGAEVDAALSDGASTTLGLAASSIHPERSGVQAALIETLIDAGAAIDGLIAGGEPLMWAVTNGRRLAAETLVRRGARVDNIVAAAALGRLDLVNTYMNPHNGLPPADGNVTTWGVPKDPKARMEQALIWACLYGRTRVVDLLLRKGVDPAAGADFGQTGFHFAAHGGHLGTVRLLIERNAPLEVKNMFGGTVLGQAVWSALHEPQPDHLPIIEALLEAGAKAAAAGYPTGNRDVDDALRRYGAG
jgi:ankyrin repeat protein